LLEQWRNVNSRVHRIKRHETTLALTLQLHFNRNSESMNHHDSEDRGWQGHRLRQLWNFGHGRSAM
jgi:hypothetical protein